MPIYTKRGDKGNTSTLDKPLSKSDLRIRAIGALDEANTLLGLAASFVEDVEVREKITALQESLFKINSILAGANIRFGESATKKLEKGIDEMDKELPVLKNFIFPGGAKAGAFLHVARAVVRRGERELTEYAKTEKVKPAIQMYVNRLSDYVFTLARYVNMKAGKEEQVWD